MATQDDALRMLHAALPGIPRGNFVQINLNIPVADQATATAHIEAYLKGFGLTGLTQQQLMAKSGGRQKETSISHLPVRLAPHKYNWACIKMIEILYRQPLN